MKDTVETLNANADAPTNSWLTRLVWVPIPVFVIVIAILAILRVETVWNPPELIPTLNIVFLTCISFFISVLAARSFLAGRSISVLMLGCGTLALGLGGIGASLYLAGPGTNSMVSVYNTMACLAGLCHLISATGIAISGPRRLRSGWPLLLASYLAIGIMIIALIYMVHDHIWPVHFVDGAGQTTFGMTILWITAAAFGLSAIILIYGNVSGDRNFYRWYGLGLGLIAAGLAGISLQSNLGDPLNWTGRISEYAGTAYMLIAVITSIRARGDWMLPLEKALQESESNLARAQQMAHLGFWVWDIGRDELQWSDETYRILGLRPGEIAPDNDAFMSYVHPDDREAVAAVIRDALAGTREYKVGWKARRKDGSIAYVYSQGEVVRENGKPVRMMGTIQDITERRQGEEALKRERDFSRAILDYAHALVVVFDYEGRIVNFNKFCEDITGYAFGDVKGKKFWDLFVEDEQRSEIQAIFNRIRESKTPAKGRNYWKTRQGGRRMIDWSNTVLLDGEGRTRYIIAIGVDVTERMQAEEAMRESEAKLSNFIYRSPDGITIVDEEGKIIVWNEGEEIISGLLSSDMVGKYVWDAQLLMGLEQERNPERLAIVRAFTQDMLKTGQSPMLNKFHERDILRQDGVRRTVQALTFPIKTSRGYMLGSISRDVTELKEAEYALREAKMQAELYLDLMGHDINNMHQIAIGYLELAMDDPELAGTGRDLIAKPLETLQRSAKLIDNVRKIQMVQKGEIKDDAVDLGDVLERVVGEYQALSGRKIACGKGPEPHRVMANELLHDVFANLVANAIKHSNGKGFDISIAVDSIMQEGVRSYRVSIEDSGPGIPDGMKEKVFNRLQRGETKARGTGLGLYLVKSLVESYHGHVWVEDRVPGDHTKGSRFIVILPAI